MTIETIVRPIVEGQLRDFVRAHPAILENVIWYKQGTNREEVFVSSIAKRIIQDLVCSDTVARLREAVATPSAASVAGEGVVRVLPRFTFKEVIAILNTAGLEVHKTVNNRVNVGKTPELVLADSINAVMAHIESGESLALERLQAGLFIKHNAS